MMSEDINTDSVEPMDKKDGPIDVHKEKADVADKVEKEVKKKVQEAAEKAQEIIRKAYGPPGTP